MLIAPHRSSNSSEGAVEVPDAWLSRVECRASLQDLGSLEADAVDVWAQGVGSEAVQAHRVQPEDLVSLVFWHTGLAHGGPQPVPRVGIRRFMVRVVEAEHEVVDADFVP